MGWEVWDTSQHPRIDGRARGHGWPSRKETLLSEESNRFLLFEIKPSKFKHDRYDFFKKVIKNKRLVRK